jgi:hypothetical protein
MSQPWVEDKTRPLKKEIPPPVKPECPGIGIFVYHKQNTCIAPEKCFKSPEKRKLLN